MSATTENYGLHQWEPEDDFLRTDFNEDNAKIDAALGTIPKIEWGEYSGQCAYNVSTAQTITLGYRPKALLVMTANGCPAGSGGGGYVALYYDGQGNHKASLTVTDTGFRVYNDQDTFSYLNMNGYPYVFAVLR